MKEMILVSSHFATAVILTYLQVVQTVYN